MSEPRAKPGASRMEAAGVVLDSPFETGRFCVFPRNNNQMKNADPLKKCPGPPYCPQQIEAAGNEHNAVGGSGSTEEPPARCGLPIVCG